MGKCTIPHHNWWYWNAIYGDGDSKAFNDVQHVQGVGIVEKQKECIGQNQKRVGSRLHRSERRLNKLGEPIIENLQNYSGIALRSNLNTVKQMQNAIWASFFPCFELRKEQIPQLQR